MDGQERWIVPPIIMPKRKPDRRKNNTKIRYKITLTRLYRRHCGHCACLILVRKFLQKQKKKMVRKLRGPTVREDKSKLVFMWKVGQSLSCFFGLAEGNWCPGKSSVAENISTIEASVRNPRTLLCFPSCFFSSAHPWSKKFSDSLSGPTHKHKTITQMVYNCHHLYFIFIFTKRRLVFSHNLRKTLIFYVYTKTSLK